MPVLVNFYVSLALKAIEMMSVISLATKGDASIVNGKAIDPVDRQCNEGSNDRILLAFMTNELSSSLQISIALLAKRSNNKRKK